MTSSPFTSLRWRDVDYGLVLPPLVFPVTHTTMAMAVAGTRDLYPPHHDPDVARAHGAGAIFLNTMWYQGLIGRYVTDWSGPNGFLRRLSIDMRSNCGPGDELTVRGRVTDKRRDESGRSLVDLSIGIDRVDDAGAVLATVTVELPE